MENAKDLRLAVLIDADNIPSRLVGGILEEIAKYGVPTFKRIYADWTKPHVANWKTVLLDHAISPLQQYNDPYFLNKGNPNLLPEYTNSFDLTHTKSWKQSSVSGSLYYRQATETIQKIVVLKSDGVTETSYQNLNSSENIGIEINAYFQLYKWWKINSSLNYYKSKIDGTNIGDEYQTDNYSFNGKMNNNFTPWKKLMLQISANYQSPTYSPLIKNYGQYYVDASFKQDLLDKKISISVRCTDIFLTQKRDYDMIGSNFEVNSRFHRQSRVLYFGITFRPFRNHKKAQEIEEEQETNIEENEN